MSQHVAEFVSIPRHHNVQYFYRKHYDAGGKPFRILFDAKELEIMASPTARLNDGCINGISHVLQDIFSAPTHPASATSRRCALFSSHDLLMVRYNATDNDVWRHTQRSQFWLKDVWIFPIHQQSPVEHWVLAYACPHAHQIFYFDSFAEVAPWKREVKVGVIQPSYLLRLKIKCNTGYLQVNCSSRYGG